jgi:hypothetical protein
MKNNSKWLLAISLIVCLLTACTGTKNVTIKVKEYSEKEKVSISNSGGVVGQRFTMKGSIPSTQTIEVTLERYEKGELVHGEPFAWMDSELGVAGDFSIAIATKNQDGSDRVYVTMPSTKLTMDFDETDLAAFSHGSLIDKKSTLTLNKPVYLAYLIGNKDASIETLQLDELGKVNAEAYDLCYVLKMVVKEK